MDALPQIKNHLRLIQELALCFGHDAQSWDAVGGIVHVAKPNGPDRLGNSHLFADAASARIGKFADDFLSRDGLVHTMDGTSFDRHCWHWT